MAERETTVPLPVQVGMNDDGRIVLEYENTQENREMARRVAGEMLGAGARDAEGASDA